MAKFLVMNRIISSSDELRSPDNSTGGCLPKFWKIINDTRYLFKYGTPPFFQEPINEDIASLLFTKLGIPHVDYKTVNLGNPKYVIPEFYSKCSCFTTTDLELVTCFDILQHFGLVASYSNFIEACTKLGIADIEMRVG